MNYYGMSGRAIAEEIGRRLRELRLQKNKSQVEVHNNTLLSLNRIKSAEKGEVKLSTLIALLREYGRLDSLDAFIPEPGISPLQIAKMKGKKRQKAGGKRKSKRVL